MWRDAVAADPAALFLRFEDRHGDVTEWTYGEFDRVVEGAAARLAAAGVAGGTAIHLALTNSPTFVAAWLAAVRLGAWIVPSDPQATAPELAEHFTRTRPVVGFCSTERSTTYRDAGVDVMPPTVIDVDESDTALGWLVPADPVDRQRPDVRDRAAVMFTSGTTGRPKGVEVTQANYAFAGATMAAACDLTADDRHLVVLPLFHANAQYYSFAAAIAVGASVALMHSFSASRFVEQAARHGATCASLFAGPMRMILARGGPAPADAPPLRLRHCWYAQNLTAAQYDTIATWLGCRPRQLYGMTETIPAVLTDERRAPRCDTMGYVTPGCTRRPARRRDRRRRRAAASPCSPATSTTPARPPPRSSTAGSCTGDRARRDEHGRYTFDGRRSDVLKVAGENVSTVEVEQAIAMHPHVADVAVVGRPDEIRDEVPVAVVVPAPDAGDPVALRAELEAWCRRAAGQVQAPARLPLRRRAAAHQRRQDQEVCALGNISRPDEAN